MVDVAGLLDLVKQVVEDATDKLCELHAQRRSDHEFSATNSREMKAAADLVLENQILDDLSPAGLPVLSEEQAESFAYDEAGLKFVVDPLDGTVNFVRSLGPMAVSVALCQGAKPLFGVIGVCPTRILAWGGQDIGSFLDGQPLRVSAISDLEHAVLCTGFPSRFRADDDTPTIQLVKSLNRFGKVRMLGSAAVSLVQVARGSAEAYLEKDIMLWDVAAGIAIVEGAGGSVRTMPARDRHSLDVEAWNGLLDPGIPAW